MNNIVSKLNVLSGLIQFPAVDRKIGSFSLNSTQGLISVNPDDKNVLIISLVKKRQRLRKCYSNSVVNTLVYCGAMWVPIIVTVYLLKYIQTDFLKDKLKPSH